MKKIIMIAVSVAASGIVFGQSVKLGIKGGVNFATFHSAYAADNLTDYNGITSFNAGGLAHIHVAPHFAVQPELYYSRQGAEYGAVKTDLGYLNLPVLAQYMVGNGFRLQTGPQVGFLLSAKYKTGEIENDIKDNYHSAEFAWAFGASYQFPGTGVGVDARYNLGITDANDEVNRRVKNRVVSVGLFYQFSK
jgi:hypothetical protein